MAVGFQDLEQFLNHFNRIAPHTAWKSYAIGYLNEACLQARHFSGIYPGNEPPALCKLVLCVGCCQLGLPRAPHSGRRMQH